MDAPNDTTGTRETKKTEIASSSQVSLQDNFNPVGIIKSQERLASSTKSLAEAISDLVEAIKYAADKL
jgi:hypothetical protein